MHIVCLLFELSDSIEATNEESYRQGPSISHGADATAANSTDVSGDEQYEITVELNYRVTCLS